MDEGLLVKYEDLIFAEAFADLYEQGQHLFSQGYFLAAGVVFRAVLEEHLRHLCERNECTPVKEKPTINDLNMALYKCDSPVYEKSVMLHVTALAAVGNDAAHNNPELKRRMSKDFRMVYWTSWGDPNSRHLCLRSQVFHRCSSHSRLAWALLATMGEQ